MRIGPRRNTYALTTENTVSSLGFVRRSLGSIRDIDNHRQSPLLLDARTSPFLVSEVHVYAQLIIRRSVRFDGRSRLLSHTRKRPRPMAYRSGMYEVKVT